MMKNIKVFMDNQGDIASFDMEQLIAIGDLVSDQYSITRDLLQYCDCEKNLQVTGLKQDAIHVAGCPNVGEPLMYYLEIKQPKLGYALEQ